jgi:lysophospholipase L1-like esterase
MLAAVTGAVSVLGLGTAVAVQAAIRTPSAAHPVAAYPVAFRHPGPESGRPRSSLSACEQELGRARPRLVVVGASFTAGVGSSPSRSWAVLLARRLHWDAVVYGVPGAGYVRAGVHREGPVVAEVDRLGLSALRPSLIIVQAGHDDIGVPPELEQLRVRQAIAVIRAQAPGARIALLTVFPGRSPTAAAYRTDRAIVTAARAADRAVIIIDPLTGGWRYAHVRDGLHPTAAGSVWIAAQVAAILRDHGIHPAPAPASAAAQSALIVCDQA